MEVVLMMGEEIRAAQAQMAVLVKALWDLYLEILKMKESLSTGRKRKEEKVNDL